MKQLQCNLIVTYLVSYQANPWLASSVYENEKHCIVIYVIGDLGITYDVHLGLIGKPAPAPVGGQGAGPLNKIWPPARGLALHSKRFTIEKNIKIVATRCQILRLKYCTKSFVGWGSAPDPAGEAYSAPPDPSLDFRGLLRKGGEGRERKGGEARKGQKGERGGEGQGGSRWGEGAGSTPKLKLGPQTPKLKLGPQNYFPGAGAVENAYWTSY